MSLQQPSGRAITGTHEEQRTEALRELKDKKLLSGRALDSAQRSGHKCDNVFRVLDAARNPLASAAGVRRDDTRERCWRGW